MSTLRLRSPGIFPRNGWEFDQPEIHWKAPHPMYEHIDALADRIVQLRKNHPKLAALGLPTDKKLIRWEIIAYNCARKPGLCVESKSEIAQAGNVVTVQRAGCCGRK